MVLDQIPENDYRVTGPVTPLSGTPCSMLRREMTVIFRLLMMTGSAVVAASAAERPNVLFIAIDDLNDNVGFLGNHPGARTPHMDRLAARGVSFTNAHCASPGCNASRTALLTGLRPSTTGIYANSTLAKMEALNAGYDEAIMLNGAGLVSECSGENLFCAKGDVVLTPPTSSGALPGIT